LLSGVVCEFALIAGEETVASDVAAEVVRNCGTGYIRELVPATQI
jgi:hypothetical protein